MQEEKQYFVKENDFIVSKTDTKGKITYCNEPFLEIVGARASDLLGKPHNIIRHPDMPRIVFKLLWDRIKSKREIFAFVKNKSFKGGYYWVFANVTASVDENGEIVGYHSVRRRPNMDGVKFIESIYKKLLEAEKTGGMEASGKLLDKILKESNVEYDELVHKLQRG
ncbi:MULTISPECIES: PAS domain-containing protein [unclassified Campylobacter]|uniref:PAS domain-containing protein n=1 Tax=unclassified Campylobacter TaxID=2593542 RepID=UPI001473322E|nr:MULTISPECIES: PAS domain-containing protein [unclassified Campylobacter]